MALKKKKIAIAGVGTDGKGLLKILEVIGNSARDIEITAIASRKKINIPKNPYLKKLAFLVMRKNF